MLADLIVHAQEQQPCDFIVPESGNCLHSSRGLVHRARNSARSLTPVIDFQTMLKGGSGKKRKKKNFMQGNCLEDLAMRTGGVG